MPPLRAAVREEREVEIDTSTDFGARAARHLEDDRVVWLTTVGPDQTPQPSPVWFLWDGDTALIYSQPGTPKLRNIERRSPRQPQLQLHAHGGDVVILTGDACGRRRRPTGQRQSRLHRQVHRGDAEHRMTPEGFAQAYSVPIRITPTGLRGH